jgi:hypothetical protein
MVKKHVFSRFERRLGTVNRDVWFKMLQIAHDFDLDKGGLYDARSGAINIWCSPEDKPDDYMFEITRGALNFPRNFMASIYGQFTRSGKNVELYLVIHNYGREDHAKALLNDGKISWREYKDMLELVERGTPSEWRWVEDKARWLIETARKESVFKDIVFCPFCGVEFPELQLFNDFVLHIMKHTKVKKIVMGEDGIYVETENGVLTPNDYIKTKKGS